MSADSNFDLLIDQIPLKKQLLFHFYPGLVILLFYIAFSRYVIDLGYPGLTALLIAELLILSPIGLAHLALKGIALNGKLSFKNVIAYKNKLSFLAILKMVILRNNGMCFNLYPFISGRFYISKKHFFSGYQNGISTLALGQRTWTLWQKYFLQAYLSTELLARW